MARTKQPPKSSKSPGGQGSSSSSSTYSRPKQEREPSPEPESDMESDDPFYDSLSPESESDAEIEPKPAPKGPDKAIKRSSPLKKKTEKDSKPVTQPKQKSAPVRVLNKAIKPISPGKKTEKDSKPVTQPKPKPAPDVRVTNKAVKPLSPGEKKVQKEIKMRHEIKKLQMSDDVLIPKLPFQRFVREICQNMVRFDVRFQSSALESLQYASEAFVSQFFEESYMITRHSKRVTLKSTDMLLLKLLKYHDNILNG